MKLSVMAIENYLNSRTPSDSLFTNWTIPTGIDQDVLKREILVQSAEFEALYPDADFLKDEITNWSKVWYKTFDKWYKVLQIQYDPLFNYSMTEGGTTTTTGEAATSMASTTSGDSTASGSNTDGIWAYNTGSDPTDTDKSDNSSSATTSSESGSQSASSETGEEIFTHHKEGNIGVMSTQKLLNEEWEAALLNLYKSIADVFITELTVPVY